MTELTQRQELIASLPCFAKLNKEDSLELAKLMDDVSYQNGETIVTEGELIDAVYIIVEGTAEVIQNKTQPHIVAVLRASEPIGLNELGFYSKTHLRTATVTATSNMLLLRITLAQLNLFFQSHPNVNESMSYITQQMLRAQFIKYATPFVKLSKERILWLTQRVKELHVEAEEVIFQEGDDADNCYLICSGKIEIFIMDKDNQEHSLAVLEKSALFGETALFTSTTRNATARALEPSQLLVLHKNDFIELITREKSTTDVLTEMVFTRTRLSTNKHVIINQHQTDDGETIINLKNPLQNTYYQLSKEGWFIYQKLDGKHSLHDIENEFNKVFNVAESNFVYNMIVDLVKGGFAYYANDQAMHVPRITITSYNAQELHETTSTHFADQFSISDIEGVTWIHIQGLQDIGLIIQLAHQFNLHPLTIEDILNTKRRSKIEMFDNYIFITIKALELSKKNSRFTSEQISLVLGKNFVLSFQENENTLFHSMRDHLHTRQGKQIREHGADYLTYRLIDIVIERYFLVLENMSEQIETFEELILTSPTSQNARNLFRFKRQMILLRKTISPVREAMSQLLIVNEPFITNYTTLYLRDLYNHIAQTVDTIETYRDMLSGLLDAYQSSLSNRMNEIMKVLTIISTIFIPMSFIAGLFGMNFIYMPVLYSPWGFPIAILLMVIAIVIMLLYFKHKKWL